MSDSMSLQGPLKRLEDLDYIRVTSWRTFEECPFEWAAMYLTQPVPGSTQLLQSDTKWTKIGTAVHSIMEHFQLDVFEPTETTAEQDAWLALDEDKRKKESAKLWALVPEAEVAPLYEYMDSYQRLLDEGYVLLWLEKEIETTFPGIGVKVRGHLDAGWLTPSGAIVVDDHKTDRSAHGMDWWREQVQQMTYAAMARETYPGKRILMRIGYPNVGRHVEWETDPSDDERLKARLAQNWAKMLMYEAAGDWPLRVNDKCKWCPLRSVCPEYETAIHDFKAMAERRFFPLSIGEQLEAVRIIKGMVEAKEEELEEQLVTAVHTAPGGRLRQGDKTWWAEHRETRTISAKDMIEVISAQVAAVPELGRFAIGAMEDVFTVKVGGVDRLMKSTQAFGAAAKKIVKKRSEKPTLKCAPAGRLQTGLTNTTTKEIRQIGTDEPPF